MTLLETITAGFQNLEALAISECTAMTTAQLDDTIHQCRDALVVCKGIEHGAALVVKTVAEVVKESRE
jgi:hypothetical protein